MKTSEIQSVTAKFNGEMLNTFPKDLYIPPEAMQVILEAFEGPLDLLLYLIKKQNIDILDIPIAEITRQYMQYIDLMSELQIELAAEYLVMAATLAEIKSRMLVPRPEAQQEESDPRAELIRRLQEYERYKIAAERLDALLRVDRDIFIAEAIRPRWEAQEVQVEVQLSQLIESMAQVLLRQKYNTSHHIKEEVLSLRERLQAVLERVSKDRYTSFLELLTPSEGRLGVVVTLIAVLELARQKVFEITQNEAFSPIYLTKTRDDHVVDLDTIEETFKSTIAEGE